MKIKTKNTILKSIGLFVLFAVLIIMLKTVDVRPIGPQNSSVGLACINENVFQLFGVNLNWYYITDWLGLVAIFVALGFALLGLIQLIRRKSLAKVDKDIIALGGFYLIVILIYILFEVWVINYRPILLNASLEPSFPSSHTMIILCIMGSAILQFRQRIQNSTLKRILCGLSGAIIIITIVGRQISGVHWFTDILGGVLLGAALIYAYKGVVLELGV